MTRYTMWNAPSDLDYDQQNMEPPVEPTDEDLRADYEDELQQRGLLPQTSWARDAAESSGPVFLCRYISGAMLTMGMYPSAQSAMLASDEAVWIPNGERRWRSQDSRTIIEPGREI